MTLQGSEGLIHFPVMEKASGLLRRSHRKPDLGSSPLPCGGDLHKDEGLTGGSSRDSGPTQWCPRVVFIYLFIPSLL